MLNCSHNKPYNPDMMPQVLTPDNLLDNDAALTRKGIVVPFKRCE